VGTAVLTTRDGGHCGNIRGLQFVSPDVNTRGTVLSERVPPSVQSEFRDAEQESTMQRILHKPVLWIALLAVVAIAVIVFVALYAGGGGGSGY
jgi:uncharacterized membrane protein